MNTSSLPQRGAPVQGAGPFEVRSDAVQMPIGTGTFGTFATQPGVEGRPRQPLSTTSLCESEGLSERLAAWAAAPLPQIPLSWGARFPASARDLQPMYVGR